MDPLERRRILAGSVQRAIVAGGRVESHGESTAVLVIGRPVNHVLHAAIGFFTWGVWWIIWFLLVLTGGERRRMMEVDETGRVHVRNFGRRDTSAAITLLSGVLAIVAVVWIVLIVSLAVAVS